MEPTVRADRYAVLKAWTICHACESRIPVSALLLPQFVELVDDEWEEPESNAVLKYIESLDADAARTWRRLAPWVRPAASKTANLSYLANVCDCGALQGDHYLHEPDGPFFPQDDDSIAAIAVDWVDAPIEATAVAATSAWMDSLVSLHPHPEWKPIAPQLPRHGRTRR
jgi:hypothetical protein